MTFRPYDAQPEVVQIAQLPNPSHIEPIDDDQDGVLDFLVGHSQDHDKECGLAARPQGRFAL